jgi:transposase
VNARDVKHLPGRPKTDTLDAVWLCKVAERQMLRPSFAPPTTDPAAARRDPLPGRPGRGPHRRKAAGGAGCRVDAQIKLSVVASDIFITRQLLGHSAGPAAPRRIALVLKMLGWE